MSGPRQKPLPEKVEETREDSEAPFATASRYPPHATFTPDRCARLL